MHESIELFYNDEPVADESPEFKQFLAFNAAERPAVYRTEWAIFDEELSVAGTIDCVVRNDDGTYTIADWKRSKEIKTSGESARPPLEHLKSANFYEYALQLNIYKHILEKHYGLSVSSLFLVVCHPNFQTYKRVDLPFLTREVNLIMDIIRMGVSLSCLEYNPSGGPKLLSAAKTTSVPLPRITPMMNKDLDETQQRALELMMSGRNVVLTSRAGSGKSHVIMRFYKHKLMAKANIALTATTGISAVLIKGSTIHRTLGIGTGNDSIEKLIFKIKSNRDLYKWWRIMEVLVLDEVSMLNPDLLDKLELMARLLRRNDKPFGGVQLVFSGDFLQLPPVKSPNGYCFNARCWARLFPAFSVVELLKNYRQDDVAFQKCLDECRFGQLSEESHELLLSREGVSVAKDGIEPTTIFSTRRNVEEFNNGELDRLFNADNSLQFYHYEMDYEANAGVFADVYIKDVIASENLYLCKGVQVILVANLDTDCGLCNGSRGVVVDFLDGFPVVQFLNGRRRHINKLHVWEIENNGEVVIKIHQLPLILGYAITAHKSQGMTLDLVRFDMSGVFEKGQAYTALSRVRTAAGLELVGYRRERIFASKEAIAFYETVRATKSNPNEINA